ncbi:MAG: glutaminyl-tRNA synthase (glutamine-hydrolyzing) subunit B [Candidatus Terrybacteria bacterium RIFCSPHIGHO2_01_FULL_58_15]|uniref:Aspartyl/glutamyl-tRNA(Asn/Gln) amidotransferase subunit B n=1 Tax=Terrybacteria sp. (strain RIFCSPHIGHO2_01_FULL_58_15) TaxID=1802363 RepID=A0A1G2PIU6_TERXR|nr:MAG: glutaminyl-tRNA synthase (glutamine-hydrolyzing) subunit B [Candidatus Terrybacteria bacterium RIFCSPHIGHO2_01_FULL_58_15]
MSYEAVIGLEIHSELKTRTKMFCACRNDSNEHHPNVNVCPICLGHPGTLPVPNREAIRLTQRVGAALGSELARYSKFDRKNYFYPDLPKGYQISQYDLPFCSGGSLALENGHTVRITRIHLEEDTGTLAHPPAADYSSVDFNRAGVPLMELVTEPDLRSAEDVALFAEELQRILRYVRASDANMEKGEMRVEVNISLRLVSGSGPRGATPRNPDPEPNQSSDSRSTGPNEHDAPLGTKVEIKNLNSIRSARLAVAYEIERQQQLLERGDKVSQETRGWHDGKEQTFSQRSKEEAHDYRYFPEPDIPPLRFTEEEISEIHAEVPELPQARRQRFAQEFGLTPQETALLVDDKQIGEYYEATVSELREWVSSEGGKQDPVRLTRLAANYLLSDLRGLLVEHGGTVGDLLIKPEDFAELMKILAQGKVTSRAAKDILRQMFGTGRDPSELIEEHGLAQLSDEGEIAEIAGRVIAENPKAIADYQSGKEAVLSFLVGKVMAASRGRANPERAKGALLKALAEE